MNTILFFWVTLALSMLFVELASPGLLYFASFALGALGAIGTYWFGFHIVAQTITFLTASVLMLVVLNVLVRRSTERNTYVSNVHALVGKQVIVVRDIKKHETGTVKINGEYWPARTEVNGVISVGTLVAVIKTSGCHVIVVPVQAETTITN